MPSSPAEAICSFCQSPVKFGKVLRDNRILCRACEVCLFFEHRLTLTAAYSGQPFRLMSWTREVLRDLFGTLDEDGFRVYKDAYLEVPKKNTKTTLCAGLVLYCVCSSNTGGTEVYSAATTKDQAGLVFEAASQMVRSSRSLRDRLKIVPSTKRIVRLDDPSTFYAAISADGDIHDGVQPAFVVRDELHRWRTRKAFELNEILERGMISLREPMVIDITTAGVVDESPLCWRRHEYARQIKEGIFEDRRFYGRIWAADADRMRADPEYWFSREARVAANPSHEDNGGYLRDEALADLAVKGRNDPMVQTEYKRYHLNIWDQKATRWMPADAWKGCDGQRRTLVGRPCFAGLDLSTTIDLTAFVLLFPDDDGTFDVLPFFWMPEDNVHKRELSDRVPYSQWVRDGLIEATPGSRIDLRAVRKRVQWALDIFDLREMAYDEWNSSPLISDLLEDGVTCIPMKQGFHAMSGPMKRLMEMVVGRNLRHAGHEVLAWNADCVEAKSDGNDNIRPVKPDRKTSNKRIDGIVALIMATDCANRNESELYTSPVVRSVG